MIDANGAAPVQDQPDGLSECHQNCLELWLHRVSLANLLGGSLAGPEANEGAGDREREAKTDVRESGARECCDPRSALENTVDPFAKRQAAEMLVREHGFSIGRACRMTRCCRQGRGIRGRHRAWERVR